MRATVNPAVDQPAVSAPSDAALSFHRALPGYQPTPLRPLDQVAAQLGLGGVALKDESDRLGLPAFKVLGAAWAIEQALRAQPRAHTLVAASAGNHGRAVAHVAAQRGLRCRVFLPARAAAARRAAIAATGAEVVATDDTYEQAVARAQAAGAELGSVLIADVGQDGPASWVIDGYATLFAEAAQQGEYDLLLVPVGVGSLAAAAARFAARAGVRLVGVEPDTAGCLTASLAAGRPMTVSTPGTTLAAPLDAADVSAAAWPDLRAGVHGTVTVSDAEVAAAQRELAAAGLAIGEAGAAPLAALRVLATDPAAAALRTAVRLGAASRVLLVATEGPTNPDSYRAALAGGG